MTIKLRTASYALIVLLMGAALVVAAALLLANQAPAGQRDVAVGQVPAAAGMSALRRAETIIPVTPQLVAGLPADMQASPGTVHRLVSGLGQGTFSLYAWRRGNTDRVCYVSTSAGGGCFGKWLGPFNVSFTDRDRIGSGEPAVVSGLVRDDVVGVQIFVEGESYQAMVRNNVAFFELPDASLSPDAVERVTVTLTDGTTEDVRL